ncbi:MAG TPA: PaaI family thioesterase, partial [Shewanella sp.]|nr:PaaI family thioesterase [Shewanella sp.]
FMRISPEMVGDAFRQALMGEAVPAIGESDERK